MQLSVASVTINANGGPLLVRQIEALMTQTHPLDEVIVVDNGSTDGSLEMAQRESPALTVLPLGENLGIGAALSVGLKYALEKGYDWVWLFDHDSQPAPDALEKLLDAYQRLAPTHNMGILSCLPVHSETGTEYHGMIWRDRFRSVAENTAPDGDYFADSVVSSGSLVKAEAVRKAGYPRADFFIDFVDHEFNLRLRRHGYQIAVIRESGLSHRIGQPQQVRFGWRRWLRPQGPAWRVYYSARNQTITVWHLVGGFRARFYLLLDTCRRMGGILLWDPDKVLRLRLLIRGFRHGIMNCTGKGEPLPANRAAQRRV